MLSHENLIANCRMITRAFEVRRGGAACSWLPVYHDMGLVGGILNPLYCGIPDTLMSPVAFLDETNSLVESHFAIQGYLQWRTEFRLRLVHHENQA